MAKKEYKLDENQQKAVNAKRNSVVSAGAGSGKTSVLSKRYTEILKRDSDCKVEQILTLTFTRKATTEMNGRIYKELVKECPDKAKDFFKSNILTLDKFCSRIAKQGSHYYGLSPDFVVDQDRLLDKIKKLALPFILKHRDNSAIKVFVNTKSHEKISEDLFVNSIFYNSTITEPIDFRKSLEQQKKVIQQKWIEYTDLILNTIYELKELIQSFDGNAGSKYFIAMKSILDMQIVSQSEADFEDKYSVERLHFINYVKEIARVRQSSASGMGAIKEKHNLLKELKDVLLQLENYIYGNKYVEDLIPLMEEFQNIINDTKRKTGLISHADASSLAKNILINYPEIRKIEKQRYKYIMIDEFQDNNSLQRDLLFLLSEKIDRMEKSVPGVEELLPNKLFFVGDEKQSIYRFRNADVSVFRGLSEDFAEGNIALETNYRSHPSLVAGFNTIFGGTEFNIPSSDEQNGNQKICIPSVFYTEQDLKNKSGNIPSYEAIYHNVKISDVAVENYKVGKSDALLDKSQKRIHIGLINKNVYSKKDELDADYSEIFWVANKIKELVKQGYSYNDFAIICRTYSLLPIYERVLLSQEIPYNSEVVKGLYSDGPVNDIMSIIRLIAYPNSRLSFMNYIRSPFVNLTMSECNAILTKINNENIKELFELNVEEILNEKSIEKFNFGKQLYFDVFKLSKKIKIADLISYLWYEIGYRYETIWNRSVEMYNYMYDMLFELARKADVDSIGFAEFVDNVDSYQDESEKLDGMEIPLESSEGVHILSIFKSKGLEYPVVFLCSIGKDSKADVNDKTVYFSKEFGMTFNTPPNPALDVKSNFFYEIQKEASSNMAAAELRRLTYVALTRAEKELYITGAIKFNSIGEKDYSPTGDSVPKKIIDVLMPTISSFVKCEIEDLSENNGELDENSESSKLSSKNKNQPNEKLVYEPNLQTDIPFDIEEIQYQKRSLLSIGNSSKKDVIEKVSQKYKDISVIQMEVPEKNTINPSHMHEEGVFDNSDFLNSSDYDEKSEDIPYSEIDDLVKDSNLTDGQREFGFNNFGTIMHSYLESTIKNEIPHIPNKEVVGLKGNNEKMKILESICERMKKEFMQSNIYKDICKCIQSNGFYKTEYSYISYEDGKFMDGQMDLVYENVDASEKTYTIVDYKSDKRIEAEKHQLQLNAYRTTLAKMLDISEKNIKCYLYYLRYAQVVEIKNDR